MNGFKAGMPRRSSIVAAACIMLLALPLVGCFFSREIANTRRDIEAAYPDLQLERQIVVNLGPLSLSTIGWMAGFAGDPEVNAARGYLKDVRRVKVGVFRTENPAAFEKLHTGRLGFEEGWEVAVRTRQEGEHVWVLYKDDTETVEDLYVVVLDEEDLVVARVRGKLDEILAQVMESHVDLNEWGTPPP